MKENISEKIHLRIEEKLYQNFKLFHIDFLEKTEYIEVVDIKKFFILLIKEWEEKLAYQGILCKAEEKIIALVNRSGKRISRLPYEGATTRISFYFKKPIKQMWDNIIYSLIKQENFVNIRKYTNGYFFPKMYDFMEENRDYLIQKYKKNMLESCEISLEKVIRIKILNKNTIKDFKGKIEKIEKNPDGISIYLEREYL